MGYESALRCAKELALKAGAQIMRIYEKDFSVEYKDDKSPLTEADKTANDIIVDELAKQFPEYAILAEESADDKSRLENDYCWIVDPLDGTKEFVKKNGEFTVNIALTYKKRPVLGVIFAPALEELYYAARGEGAYLHSNEATRTLTVSDRTDALRFVASRSHISDKMQKVIDEEKPAELKQIGSSLKGCLIAKAEADIYYRFGKTMEWDTCAMQCIVEEAGGIFKEMGGSEMLYNREDPLNAKGFYILNKIENELKL